MLPVRGTCKYNLARNEDEKCNRRVLHLQNETRKHFEIVFAAEILHFFVKRIETNGKIDTATTNLLGCYESCKCNERKSNTFAEQTMLWILNLVTVAR